MELAVQKPAPEDASSSRWKAPPKILPRNQPLAGDLESGVGASTSSSQWKPAPKIIPRKQPLGGDWESGAGASSHSSFRKPAPKNIPRKQPLAGDLEPGAGDTTTSSSTPKIEDFHGLSRGMSIVLRYGGNGLGHLIDSDGYIAVNELAGNLNRTVADVMHVAQTSAKGQEQRFEISTDGMSVRSTRREKLPSSSKRQQTSAAGGVEMQTAEPLEFLWSAQSLITPFPASLPSPTPSVTPSITPTVLPAHSAVVQPPPPQGQPQVQEHRPPPPPPPAATATQEGMASHMHQPKGMPLAASKEAEEEVEAEGGAKASEEAATAGSTPTTVASSSETGNVYEF